MKKSFLLLHTFLSLYLIIGICTPHRAWSVDPRKALSQYMLKFWDKKDGLPQNSANAVLQTRDGYLWIGTQEGLVRFDGVAFTLYDKKNTEAIKNNFIATMAEDPTGVLWIGTWGGLVRMDQGIFTFFGNQDGFTDDAVRAILADGTALWIGTDGSGLFRFENGKFRQYTVSDGLSSNQVLSLCGAPGGMIWIGTDGGGLCSYNGKTFRQFSDRDGLSHNTIRSVLSDSSGQLWIGTWGGGLNRYQKGTFIREPAVNPSALITTVFMDRHGSLWIGTDAHGVYRLGRDQTETLTQKDGLPLNVIMSVCEDREGSVWIGTGGGGLGRISDCSFFSYTTRNGLPHDMIWSVYEDPDGDMWFGTDGGGIARMRNQNITTYTTRDGLSHNVVTAIFRDRKGDMWFGTRVQGLNRFSGGIFQNFPGIAAASSNTVRCLAEDFDGHLWIGTQSGLVQTQNGRIISVFNTSNQLPSNIVRTMLLGSDSSLWVGTNGGIHRYRQGVFRTWNTDQGLTSNVVLCLFEDPGGYLWIGTWGGGLNRMKDGRIAAVTTAKGLYDDGVFSILMDDRQNLWMSSNNGVFRSGIKDLHDAADGKISAITCSVFGEAEGLKSAECNTGQPSGFRSADGRLWFPTIQGAAVVDPDRIIENIYPPPVLIEYALVDGKPVHYDNMNEILFAPGSNRYEFHYTGLSYLAPEKVKFRYRLDGFDHEWIDAGTRRTAYYTNIPSGHYTFRVTACNNSGIWNTENAEFRFYLEPFFYQTVLFYILCGLVITGSALGVYRFREQQFTRRQKELEDLVRMKTRIVESQKSELQEALENLKTTQMQLVQTAKMSSLGQLVAGMAHEINNPITVINGYLPLLSLYLNDIQKCIDGSGSGIETRKILDDSEAVLKSCSGAVDRIKQIITNLRSFSRLDEAEYKFADLHENLESTLTLFLPNYQRQVCVEKNYGEIPPFYFYPGQLNQVFMNLLINAAEAIIERNQAENREQGNIRIQTGLIAGHENGRNAQIEISDDGIGIPENIRERIFDPFFTTKSVGSGMGLGLSISYGIIQKHKGKIEVFPAESGGTRIMIEIPC